MEHIGNRVCTIRRNNVILLISITTAILFLYGAENVISYSYTLFIFSLINLLFPKSLRYYNFISFEIYLFIAIIIFTIQYIELPMYMGLSGPEGGIGTDDIRYYEKITDVPLKVSSTAGWIEAFSFSNFLRFIYPFRVVSPLNIIILNVIGTAFCPSLTYLLAQCLHNNQKVAKNAAILVLICPSIWSNGLIIMRDIWTVSLTLTIFILVLKGKYIAALLPAILLVYLRFGSVIFVILGIIIILKYTIFDKSIFRKIIFWVSLCIVCAIIIASLSYIIDLTGGKLESSFFRESFINQLIREDENGIITRIAQLPTIIRTPLLLLFFFFTPFLKFKAYTFGIFNIRTIFDTFLTPIWLLLVWKYIFKSIYIAFNGIKQLKIVVWISIFMALALSIVSLQVRHKVIMMPILAIMAAIGMNEKKTKYDQIFNLLAIVIIIFEFLFALR